MRIAIILLIVLSLAACERTFRNMYAQPRYNPLAPSALWPDGRSSRPPVAGTMAYSAGVLANTSSGRRGAGTAAAIAPGRSADTSASLCKDASSQTHTEEVLKRGRNRYDIFCAPCHSIVGDGDGMIVRRGFPAPPSFHDQRVYAMTNNQIYKVITVGRGAMASYATSLEPSDRCAIVAYVRALQLSQHAPLAAVPATERQILDNVRPESRPQKVMP